MGLSKVVLDQLSNSFKGGLLQENNWCENEEKIIKTYMYISISDTENSFNASLPSEFLCLSEESLAQLGVEEIFSNLKWKQKFKQQVYLFLKKPVRLYTCFSLFFQMVLIFQKYFKMLL